MVVNENTLARNGIQSILSRHPDIQVVGEATDLADAYRARVTPDLFLVEVPAITADIVAAARAPGGRGRVPVLFLAADIRRSEFDLLGLGCCAISDRHLAAADLVAAVRVMAAGYVLVERTRAATIAVVSATLGADVEGHGGPLLTRRESEILDLMARGLSNSEIAAVLTIAPSTVKSHVKEILSKLGLRNRVQAAVYAAGAAQRSW
ncbi:response regulator transcription factor [Nonomuraea sp. NPDC005650]|uniref:response regulator transcription factor n=1 Tax=Nonomuraea sp. NPDC005650 TaxID=3157045 RepID=UPI0033BACF7C